MIPSRKNSQTPVAGTPVADKLEIGTSFEKMPPAGPHDRPELTNYDACPGAGAFPPQQLGAGVLDSDPGAG